MVLDIGGGILKFANCLLERYVTRESVRRGDKFDEAITQVIRRNTGNLIGEATGRAHKDDRSAYPGEQVVNVKSPVRGRETRGAGVPVRSRLNYE